jgi:hypothetical protein
MSKTQDERMEAGREARAMICVGDDWHDWDILDGWTRSCLTTLVAQRRELRKALTKVVERGCSCLSMRDEDWHAKTCLIPQARAALAKTE